MGTIGSGERTVAGKEAHWILQSDRSLWKAFSASAECKGCWLFAWRGRRGGGHPNGPRQRPIPTFRHFREKLMIASVPWISLSSSLSTASTPPDCPEAAEGRRGTGGPGRLAGSVDAPVGFSLSCLHCNLLFPRGKKKERNIRIHLSPKWSSAAKEKCRPTSGGKAALTLRYVGGRASGFFPDTTKSIHSSRQNGPPEGQNR